MTTRNVLIAPCYGNKKSQSRFDTTVAEEVEIGADGRGAHLTAGERATLSALHRGMTAPFWGARAKHQAMMARLSPGDVVLFTGDKKIKAIGEFEHLFQNPAFADAMWRMDPEEDGFAYIYSLANVRYIDVDRDALLSLPGFDANDPLAGQRIIQPALVDAVLDAFGVEQRLAAGLAERVTASRVVAGERHNADTFARAVPGKVDVAARAESRLVVRYQAHCGSATRFRTPDGRYADFYREHGGEVEIIEAKSAASREKVREAVAQLLDYAPFAPKPVTRLGGLFPEAPDDGSIRFLLRYGIDCVYADGDGFARIEADEARRAHMLPVWREK